jgi:hypothetical protein
MSLAAIRLLACVIALLGLDYRFGHFGLRTGTPFGCIVLSDPVSAI